MTTFLGLTQMQWLDAGIAVLIILFVAIFGRRIIVALLTRVLSRLAGKTNTVLDDLLISAVAPPLRALIVVVAFVLAFNRLDFLPSNWYEPLVDVFFLLYLLIGTTMAWRIINATFQWYIEEMAPSTESQLDEVLAPFLRRVALGALIAIILIMFLNQFEVDVSGLVATLGITSLAIALAAQAALGDIFSGIIIMIDRPFRIGDRIEIEALQTWGDVIDIGLRSTHIRTRDNRMVIVPNALIGKSLVVNYTYPDTQYRIQTHIGIGYTTDIERARNVIIKAIEGVEGVLLDKPVEALFLEFGAYSLNFRLRWWLESYEDTRRMFDRVNSAVFQALIDSNIDLPFPQQEVHHNLDDAFTHQVIEIVKGSQKSV